MIELFKNPECDGFRVHVSHMLCM